MFFKVSESGLIPVNSEEHCDIAIGRSAVYLYLAGNLRLGFKGNRHAAYSEGADTKGRGALELLVHTEIFDALDGEQLRELSKQLLERKFPAATVIVRQDDVGSSLFVVAEGALTVSARDPLGTERQINTLGPGECFGEMSLLTGAPRSATVIAETDSVVYEIRREHLRPMMENRAEIVEALSELMAERQLGDTCRQQYETLRAIEGDSLVRMFSRKIGELFGLKGTGQG